MFLFLSSSIHIFQHSPISEAGSMASNRKTISRGVHFFGISLNINRIKAIKILDFIFDNLVTSIGVKFFC
jgi:hypothetical protein